MTLKSRWSQICLRISARWGQFLLQFRLREIEAGLIDDLWNAVSAVADANPSYLVFEAGGSVEICALCMEELVGDPETDHADDCGWLLCAEMAQHQTEEAQ